VPVSVLQRIAGVITVAGVDASGKDVTKPPAGAVIDVYAPGKSIVGLGPRGGQLVGAGAGVATGFVAATVALVRQYRPELTPAQLKQRLLSTGYPLAAVTAATGPRAGIAAPQHITAPVVPAGPGGRGTALTILGLSVAVMVAAAITGAVARRASRRGWCAATAHRPDPPSRSAPGTADDGRSVEPDRPAVGAA
jgi:hypothetical protein